VSADVGVGDGVPVELGVGEGKVVGVWVGGGSALTSEGVAVGIGVSVVWALGATVDVDV